MNDDWYEQELEAERKKYEFLRAIKKIITAIAMIGVLMGLFLYSESHKKKEEVAKTEVITTEEELITDDWELKNDDRYFENTPAPMPTPMPYPPTPDSGRYQPTDPGLEP